MSRASLILLLTALTFGCTRPNPAFQLRDGSVGDDVGQANDATGLPDRFDRLDVFEPPDLPNIPDAAASLDNAVPVSDADVARDVVARMDAIADTTVVRDTPADQPSIDQMPTSSGAVFLVGSFARGTGPQSIGHALGAAPKALILWTSDKTNAATSADYRFAVGISDGPNSSRSLAAASQSDVAKANSTRRMATKALTITQWGPAVVAEADLTAWSATQFTLNWTTSGGPAGGIVHYALIGGDGVSAKVIDWQTKTANGVRAITGTGFKPTAVLNFYLGLFTEAAPPSDNTDADLGWGVIDGAGSQWASHIVARTAVTPTSTLHAQITDGSIFVNNVLEAANKRASLAFNPDGFTVTFSAPVDQDGHIFSLALAGVAAKAGSFNKTTAAAPARQSIPTAGFRPGLVLFGSVQDIKQTGSQPNSRWGMGASDGTSQASASLCDVTASATTNTFAADRTTKAFVKITNAQRTIDAECNVDGISDSEVTLTWSPNDTAASEMTYLMLGPLR